MDKEYCSVRFIRMLKTINIIHEIQNSDEFRDFYHWLRNFYKVEILEFIGDVCGEFSLKEGNSPNTLDFEKTVESYTFDCIQYGRNKINQGTEALLIKRLGNDRFISEMQELRLKFKEHLIGNEQLKEAYIKLTEHIDIRYLVIYRFNPEHLFLTWFSIENHFSKLEQRTIPLTHDEFATAQEFEAEIYRYLHDFEILAKNKGYEVGHVTLTDSSMFKEEAHDEDYLTLRLAENFRVPVVDALLDYLEFAKFKLNDTSISIGVHGPNNSRLEQLHRIIQILNAEKSKKASQKGAGVFTLLCYTVYKLREHQFVSKCLKNKSDNKKKFLDYLANLLQLVGIRYSYNAAVKNRAHLELIIYFTESAIRHDLFAMYFEFLSKTRPVIKLSNLMVSTKTDLSTTNTLDSTDSIDLYREITQNIRVNGEIKLFDITANKLSAKINTEKEKLFSFAGLYTNE